MVNELHNETNISELELTVGAYMCLKKAGVFFIDTLRTMTTEQLLNIKGMTANRITEIKGKLDELSLPFEHEIDISLFPQKSDMYDMDFRERLKQQELKLKNAEVALWAHQYVSKRADEDPEIGDHQMKKLAGDISQSLSDIVEHWELYESSEARETQMRRIADFVYDSYKTDGHAPTYEEALDKLYEELEKKYYDAYKYYYAVRYVDDHKYIFKGQKELIHIVYLIAKALPDKQYVDDIDVWEKTANDVWNSILPKLDV